MILSHLAGPRGYRIGVATAVIVGLPLLFFGFFGDDYLFMTTFEGRNPLGSPLDLFVFGTGNPEQATALVETGPYPWFGDPEFRVRFFRPLACALMAFDYRVFGQNPLGYNLHSLAWYVLLCLGAMLIFRRTLPPAVGVLALFLFVVDESHVVPAAWWSNRHSVIAVGVGFLGVAAHLRWREDGWRPGLPLSMAAFVASLLAAETGLCVLAYVLAYELFGAHDKIGRRFLCVLPASALALTYFFAYRLGGFGAQFSDIYIDPGGDPAAFLLVAPARFAMLAGAQFFMLPVEATVLRTGLEPLFIVLGGVGLAVVVLAMRGIWPRLEERERHALGWLIPGAVLATTPGLAAIVNSRVLLAASLGGAAIIATLIVHLWRGLRAAVPTSAGTGPKWLTRPLLWFFILGHLGLAALSWPVQVTVLNRAMSHLNAIIRNSEIDETRIGESQVIVFNAPDPYSGLYPLMLRSFDGQPAPRSWWTLSFAPFTHRLTRTGDREMELDILEGQMFTTIMERLFRSIQRPMQAGETVDLKGLRITTMAVGDKGPSRLRLEFSEPPESDRYQLLVFRNGAYRRLDPPGKGESVDLPHGFR